MGWSTRVYCVQRATDCIILLADGDRKWLDEIGETDPAVIAEALTACRSDPDARAYFAGSAAREMPKIAAPVAGTAMVSARI